MWAVFVGILELVCILSEALLALLASEYHLVALEEFMVFAFLMALGAVEPLATCRQNQPSSSQVFVSFQRSAPLFLQISLSVCFRVLMAQMWGVVGAVEIVVHVQQAERMATCALRTCLLVAVSTREYPVAMVVRTTCCLGCVQYSVVAEERDAENRIPH